MKNNIYFKSQVKKSKVIHRGAMCCTTPRCNRLHPESNKDFEKKRAHVRTHTREVSRRAGNREVSTDKLPLLLVVPVLNIETDFLQPPELKQKCSPKMKGTKNGKQRANKQNIGANLERFGVYLDFMRQSSRIGNAKRTWEL